MNENIKEIDFRMWPEGTFFVAVWDTDLIEVGYGCVTHVEHVAAWGAPDSDYLADNGRLEWGNIRGFVSANMVIPPDSPDYQAFETLLATRRLLDRTPPIELVEHVVGRIRPDA